MVESGRGGATCRVGCREGSRIEIDVIERSADILGAV